MESGCTDAAASGDAETLDVARGDDGFVYALDAATGSERWRFETDGSVGSSLTVADSLVYVGAGDYVYAIEGSLDASDVADEAEEVLSHVGIQ